jgi:hypothetical protein
LHLPIFPFDLVELVPSLSLVYIYSATSRTHEFGKREAAFKTKITPDPSITLNVLQVCKSAFAVNLSEKFCTGIYEPLAVSVRVIAG